MKVNKLKALVSSAVLFASLFLLPTDLASHSGGLDSSGCHGGSRPYHCHRSASEMVPSSSGGNRLRCSAGSRSKDCINRRPTSPKPQNQKPTAPENGYVRGDGWYCDNGFKADYYAKTCTKN